MIFTPSGNVIFWYIISTGADALVVVTGGISNVDEAPKAPSIFTALSVKTMNKFI